MGWEVDNEQADCGRGALDVWIIRGSDAKVLFETHLSADDFDDEHGTVEVVVSL